MLEGAMRELYLSEKQLCDAKRRLDEHYREQCNTQAEGEWWVAKLKDLAEQLVIAAAKYHKGRSQRVDAAQAQLDKLNARHA